MTHSPHRAPAMFVQSGFFTSMSTCSPMRVVLSGSVLTHVSFTHPIKSGSPDRKHKRKEYVLACSTLAKRIWLVAQVADKWKTHN